MNYSIIAEPGFLQDVKRLSKKYKSLKQDLVQLQTDLLANPTTGVDLGNAELLALAKERAGIADE